ncbi:hypothetical protein EZV73_22120 [Acidaminobacter sp. JC074]|uniref:hypothetical protein n=1 Tax=Acidaminobacter sp. JC074 TaxID=2530199 RepID=UPI001F11747D|nr:hypothetical protein [Acidaminobacter sp. JC074]MCH4890295.1 hypothetical protein [Acidaminobacter sp. JC074]
MKKKLYIGLSGIQVLLLIGAYLVQDFSMKRMGMMRHVMFTNQKWEKSYPVETIISVSVAISIILLVIVVYKHIKRKSYYQLIETLVVSGGATGFVLLNSTESFRSYYFICLILALSILIQYVKQIIDIKKTDSF